MLSWRPRLEAMLGIQIQSWPKGPNLIILKGREFTFEEFLGWLSFLVLSGLGAVVLRFSREQSGLQILEVGGSVWESNPSCKARKSLNYLSRGLQIGNNWEQNRGYFFDCLPLRIPNHMPVDSKSNSSVGMTKLFLRHLRRCAS